MNKINKEIIITFWNQHFKYVDTTTAVTKEKTIDLFRKLHGNEIKYQEFTIISGQIGVKGKKVSNCKLFIAEPISHYAKSHYQLIENPLIDGKQLETPPLERKQLETQLHNGKGTKRKLKDSPYTYHPTTPSKKHLYKINTKTKMVEDGKDQREFQMFWYNHYDSNNTTMSYKGTNMAGKNRCENKNIEIEARKIVHEYWIGNYDSSNHQGREISADAAYQCFLTTNPHSKLTLQQFNKYSNTYTELKSIQRNKLKMYKAMPASLTAANYHKPMEPCQNHHTLAITNRHDNQSIVKLNNTSHALNTHTNENDKENGENDSQILTKGKVVNQKEELNHLENFLKTHYHINQPKGNIKMAEIYQFYQEKTKENMQDFQKFKRTCGNPIGLKRKKPDHYYIEPKSEEAKQFHQQKTINLQNGNCIVRARSEFS